MFAKALFVLSTFAGITYAAPSPQGNVQCDSGALQCCDSVQPASSASVAPLLQNLGITVQDVNVPVGVTCTPITVLGAAGGTNCASQPVCCQNNAFNGVVAVGCTPVNVGV